MEQYIGVSLQHFHFQAAFTGYDIRLFVRVPVDGAEFTCYIVHLHHHRLSRQFSPSARESSETLLNTFFKVPTFRTTFLFPSSKTFCITLSSVPMVSCRFTSPRVFRPARRLPVSRRPRNRRFRRLSRRYWM